MEIQNPIELEKLDPFCRNLKDGSVTGTLSRELELSVDDGAKIHHHSSHNLDNSKRQG